MTEPVGKGIEIEWDINPRKTRVWIDGHEISKYVKAATIHTDATSSGTMITLECYPMGSPENLYSVGELDAN